MLRLRRLALTHNALAALMICVALLMKALVPAGFMPAMVDGRFVIAICSGTGPVSASPPAMAGMAGMAGMTHGGHDRPDEQHDNKPQPCAFAGLQSPSLAAADPVVLAIAVAFVLALGLRIVVALRAALPAHLRPPLRGPPVAA
ncbi:hypothetical protein QLH51_01670 [Sphingomonas sp. 2R-10]|uniref:DUF2946 family protein n=1 Tax=Sphingomonas sp. 2R-10 TaxID=3045148 RepID=UPI0019CFDF73|nr:DUF2946 family protein [Sphingomonas sp. 2R-10]MDJ0275517.1 hypothetical protein [Sphingomonas sp. 2R-10]